MTQDEAIEVNDGKTWLEELISKTKDVKVPAKYLYLARRIRQLKCISLYSQNIPMSHLKILIRYALGAGFIFYLLIKSKFSKKKIIGSFSIWDSDIDLHVTSVGFNEFLNSNQIIYKENESHLFVRSSKSNKHSQNATYCENPIFDALFYRKISWKDCLKIMSDIGINFYRYLKVSLAIYDAKDIFKDFLTEPLIKYYNRSGMVAFYRTNSNFSSQEFWCEDINYHTVWYSINSICIQYKCSAGNLVPENPFYYLMHFGTSWTWNEFHATWLKKLLDHKINVVGPIMFYKSSVVKNKVNRSAKRAIVFDVTPCEESYLQEIKVQKGLIYYSEKNSLKFIEKIFESFEGENWEIVLKPKRAYVDFHSKKYLSYLSHAESSNNMFKVLSPEVNLFDEIQKSDLVISIPFSSPYDIAKSLNVEALYFDPTGDIDFKVMGYAPDEYCENVADLRNKLKKL